MTSSIARMNLFLHGIVDFRIERGDTLAEPRFLTGDRLQQFDVVLANPPYSIKQWDRTLFASDPYGRNRFGTPPPELLSEQARFLLHELRALMAQEGLVSQQDTVVVAARHAYPEYRHVSAYVCQASRAFRDGVDYMGFYYDSAIQPEIAHIQGRRDNVPFAEESAAALKASEEEADRRIGELILTLVGTGGRTKGELYQLFLLSPPDDPNTLRLPHPVKNTKTDHKGKPWAWTMSQTYTDSNSLRQAPKTTTELEELGA
jgi:N-6 DNA Methylase